MLVQKVAQSFLAKVQTELRELKPGLPDAGRYIGYLERFLILTFVIVDNYEAIGFLLAAKTLVRYPDISEDRKGHFGEYFLVGTLTSFGIALIAGVLVGQLD